MDKSIFDTNTSRDRAEESCVQTEIYRDCVFCESVGDFELPDYLPEIRKIVRVTSKAIPAGRFVGGERADLGGSVAHTVVYTDPDGALASSTLTTDYEAGVAIPAHNGTSVSAFSDSTVESSSCRLIGPRKLSLRARVRTELRLCCDMTIPRHPASERRLELEELDERHEAMRRLSAQSGQLTFTDSVRLDSPSVDAVRVIFSDAELHAEDASVMPNGIRCRGAIWCRAVISDGGTPFQVSKKIPFEEILPCDGAEDGYRCTAYGICESAMATPIQSSGGGCELVFDVTAELCTTAYKNLPFIAVADAFMPGERVICRQSALTLGELGGVAMGNFSISGSGGKESELDGVCAVIDTDGRIKSCKVSVERGRAIVTGECALSLILSTSASGADGKNGYGSCEYDIPFRCELDTHTSLPSDAVFECRAELLGAKSRIDGSSFSSDAEICIALSAMSPRETSYLSSAEPAEDGETASEPPCLTVYYPSDSDSLWSVAKKYGVSRASVIRSNSIPESALDSSALHQSIDGISCLIIE